MNIFVVTGSIFYKKNTLNKSVVSVNNRKKNNQEQLCI